MTMKADGATITLPALKGEMKGAFSEALTEWFASNKPASSAVQPDTAKSDAAKMAQEKLDQAKMAAVGVGVLRGPIESLDGFTVPVLNVSLPLGSAAAGGLAGLSLGGIADVVFPRGATLNTATALNIAANLGAASILMKWGPGAIGGSASKFGVGLIVLKLAMRFLPIEGLVNQAVAAVSKPLAGFVPKMGQEYSAVAQAQEVAQRVSFAPQTNVGGPWA